MEENEPQLTTEAERQDVLMKYSQAHGGAEEEEYLAIVKLFEEIRLKQNVFDLAMKGLVRVKYVDDELMTSPSDALIKEIGEDWNQEGK